MWTWSNSDGPSRSCLDRILVRLSDRHIVKCPQFHFNSISDHKIVTGEMILDKMYKQGTRYWKLNMSLLVIEEYKNRIRTVD